MKVIKIRSKSNPKIFRTVRIKDGLAGEKIYECSCPANVWFRVSNGRSGKEICRHIKEVKEKNLCRHFKVVEKKLALDKETR